jgi:hypothetical protein
MPVEIRELQIRVTVNQQSSGAVSPPASLEPGRGNEDEKKGIINQCIEQVLEIINNKKER